MPPWEFYRHMPVYLADGRKLGFTLEIGHAVNIIRVQSGHLLVRDWYIPTDGVRTVDGDGVHLALSREDLRSRQLHLPPRDYLQHQGATPGYEYTSGADIPPSGDREPPAGAAHV